MLVQWNGARKHFEKMSYNKPDLRRGIIGNNHPMSIEEFEGKDWIDGFVEVMDLLERIYPEFLFDEKKSRFIMLNSEYLFKLHNSLAEANLKLITYKTLEKDDAYEAIITQNDGSFALFLMIHNNLTKTEILNHHKKRGMEPWLYANTHTW